MSEEVIKEVTSSVLKYILPDTWSDAKKEANPIAAERVVEAIKDGKKVEIKNAVIDGPFILKSVNVEGEVTIQRTKIRGPIDWSYATFKRVLNLGNSIFETFETDATFTAVTVEKDIFLDGATFCGKAVFADITVMGAFYSRSTTFKKEVIFTDGTFKKRIEFSKSTFVGKANFGSARIGSDAVFTGATFKEQANFNSAQIDGHAFFNPATFVGEAKFVSARIGSTAVFTGAEFKKLASFNRVQIEESAFFKSATFEGDADFGSARIGSTAEFTGAKFGAKFEKLASFNGAQIEGSAFFKSATFEGEANFGSARIGSAAVFTGAEFKQRASFNRAQIEGAAFFSPAYLFNIDVVFKDDLNKGIIPAKLKDILKTEDYSLSEKAIVTKENDEKWRIIDREKIYIVKKEDGKLNIYNPTTFEDEANFGSARIGSTAEFMEAAFNKQAIFNRARIEESAFFKSATFVGEANFGSARIGSNAVFTGAEFKQQAIFDRAQIEGSALFDPATFVGEANFRSARIGSNARFSEAKSKQQAYFNSTQIERESHFEGTVFANDVSFQDSTLKTVFWGESNVQFIKNIDLRGCIYDRIHPISFWKQLMEHLGPYDRQPFTQLEETFRRAGKDKLADDVYYERKCREYTENIAIRKPGAWSAWLLTALRKLSVWSAWLLTALRKRSAWLLDRFLFWLTGYGVRLNRLLVAFVLILMLGTVIFNLEGAVTLDIQPHYMMSSQVTLPWWEAFWVSLNTFLPIGIPSGADWKPSSHIIPMLGIKFTTFATLLDLAGWILVPVGVAGIAGLLKRSK